VQALGVGVITKMESEESNIGSDKEHTDSQFEMVNTLADALSPKLLHADRLAGHEWAYVRARLHFLALA
jgi:hypothetical protein